MISPDQFVRLIKSKDKKVDIVRFATVDPNYISGRPSLIFDRETVLTVKQYTYLSSYVIVAGDRVVVIKGVVIGKII